MIRSFDERPGRFVSEADGSHNPGGHYELDTVPPPPEVRRALVPEVNFVTGEPTRLVAETRIKLGCPRCFSPVFIEYTGRRVRRDLLDEVMDNHGREYSDAVRRERDMQDWQRRQAMVGRHLFDFEDRDDA